MSPVSQPVVIFDCDGTLIDSRHRLYRAVAVAFEGEGLEPPDREAVAALTGLPFAMALRRALPGLAPAQQRALTARFEAALNDPATGPASAPFAGMVEVVRGQQALGRALAVFTGMSRRGLGAVLAAAGLTACFRTWRTADDGPGKPSPWGILDILAELDGVPENAVMIGDSTHDLEAAAAAGVAGLGVAWGNHPASRLGAAGAAAIAPTPAALPALIDQVLARFAR